nr:MFS transporter [Pectobacterium versatile]
MPAGLLSSIATGLDVSESLAGQFITAFALGALLSAIPATALTRGLRRKPLLLVAISGFAVVNAVTAVSDNYVLSLAARFVAGLFGGVVWSMLAGYASRMVPRWLLGRAIAIVGAGSTAALVLGVPIGGLLGSCRLSQCSLSSGSRSLLPISQVNRPISGYRCLRLPPSVASGRRLR